MLTKEDQVKIVEAAKIGMPWKVIARLVNMSLSELCDLRRDNTDLARDVLRAQAECMDGLLKQLNEVKQWQAITFILESRWPEHFGRNRKKKKTRPADPDPSEEMLESLTPEEFQQFRTLVDKMHAAKLLANSRKERSRSLRGPEDPARLCGPGVANS